MAVQEVSCAGISSIRILHFIERFWEMSKKIMIFVILIQFSEYSALKSASIDSRNGLLSTSKISLVESKFHPSSSPSASSHWHYVKIDSITAASAKKDVMHNTQSSKSNLETISSSVGEFTTTIKKSNMLSSSSSSSMRSSEGIHVSNVSTASVSTQPSEIHFSSMRSTRSKIISPSVSRPSSSILCPSIIYSEVCTPFSISTIYSIFNVTSMSFVTKTTSTLTSLPVLTSKVLETSIKITERSSGVVKTSIHVESITTAAKVIYSSAFVIIPAIKQCDVAVMTFSEAVHNLTQCLLMHLHPMRACYKCSVQYDAMQDLHTLLFSRCVKKLILDFNARYQVIPKMFLAHVETWNALGCKKCYSPTDPTKEGAKMSPKFMEFLHLYNKTMNCFANNTHIHIVQNGSKIPTFNNTKICTNCDGVYKEMQEKFKFYEDSEDVTDTEWCADINVSVNETRHLWSSEYGCGKTTKDLESIIALTCFFCFLPIVFYVGAKLHSDVRERKSANRYNDSD